MSVGLPGAEEQGVSTAEAALEGAGSGIESEPSLSSSAGNGIAAGMDQLPSTGSPSAIASPGDVVAPSVSRDDEVGPISSAAPGPDSLSPASPDGETGPGLGLVQGAESAGVVEQAGNPESENPNMETSPSAVSPEQGELPGAVSSSGSASPSGDVAASSVSDSSSLGALEGAGSAAESLQPSLGAGTGVLPAAEEGASEGASDGGSTGQSQAPVGMGTAVSVSLDGETGGVLQSASSSSSTEGSSLPVGTGEAADETSLPGAGAGLNTGLEPAGPQEASVSAPGTQSSANTEVSDGKLGKADVVEVPGGASVNGGPSPGASLVPAAPDNSGVSNAMSTSVAASLLLPGHGLSSGLAPSGDPDSAPSTQSGSSSLLPGSPAGLPGSPAGLPEEAGGAQSWSLEDEVASGMPAPLGEASPHAPTSPNAAPVLPSAPQRGNSAEGVSASPGLSALPAVPLYGYGARENDREYVERRVDFNSPLFKPETGFPFGKTLRSSLYFTDNGQIIFPASDNSILTYPNPPPNGFNGHEDVPMIAVFWDNADFSRGVGTTFYQEFSTLNTAKPPFVLDVEAKVRRYLRSSYSAVWTLKITWERAPAYAARTDTHKTVTYQAVLTTDGFRSYILMLYQDGGMQWDYTRLTSTNVLIGYTSGDGFYHNDDLTKRPPAAKYRPDQFRGYNTDLRGLWIYKLESRVGINYWLKCLAWTGKQQEPRAWSQGLPTCPCSLQQGQQDPRFKSSRGGKWGARVSMLHSASPNQHGAGVRCVYDSQNQLIEGRQERYWRSSRQASPYRDQELKLYDWCCNRAGSAHLCARYSEKRPRIGCDGYQSPSQDSSKEAEDDSDEQTDEEDK
ncbi:mucin-4-like isoform X2 [Oenanthe melanoleuca]|uniref:mucin-4-like isoform X2 n=1 Tax=Oenanthe melanoleuca TaxID=2939378 RepID=UPI0024C12296|nr:mucin-4-like isoform X2 [Oenanthe melanoleuca]